MVEYVVLWCLERICAAPFCGFYSSSCHAALDAGFSTCTFLIIDAKLTKMYERCNSRIMKANSTYKLEYT